MRASTLLNRVFTFTGATVTAVDYPGHGPVTATVKLTARTKLSCPHCPFSTTASYDTRWNASSWRHLDTAGTPMILKMLRRRLRCPAHGVVVQAVPFARHGSRFTRDFEDLVAWLVTRMDKSSVSAFTRIAWRTVGAICERVVADQLDASRFGNLVNLGVDEISWRKHHNYLTLVSDHETSTILWGSAGKNAATLDKFFSEIGPENTANIQAVSMDMGAAFIKSVKANAPNAAICIDPFHVVQLGTKALETVRRAHWQRARSLPDQAFAKKYQGNRYALLKNPGTLTPTQQETLEQLREDGGTLWEGYLLKESLREVFAGDLEPEVVMAMIQSWCDAATTSGLGPFMKAGATLRGHIDGVHAAVTRGLSNGKHEGLNNKIRTMTRRSYGFHSPEAALALIMLACGPVEVRLPYKR
ncbi:ISL3 family transposase [Paeniglutamicibacter cryotolerans]|uniref:Transposase n=1 Tax=Paeniglutamicibacter cryotolerans TaxID=670079 RepID=A0A839QS38_9MICC|nr:ISL3 family transposase [Paeniglutamicibacter cryotolerans]MBB2997594.1 transposase [Paeniglutamicibacter cryotolerans]